MTTFGIPILFALFVWWFSTGIVLYVVGMPRRNLGWTIGGAGLLFVVAIWVLVETRSDPGAFATYATFTAAIVAWGFVEVLFLTGLVTGPRRSPCPPGAEGWQRVRFAVEAILYHELLLLAVGGVIGLATWGGDNMIAVWTYAVLWIMRLSAKLNLFLGVPVLNDGLLPEAIGFIKTYFRRRSTNFLFPISIAGTAVALLLLAREAVIDQSTGLTLIATLLALALLEHVFMVLPLPLEAAWGWGMKSRARPGATHPGLRPAIAPAGQVPAAFVDVDMENAGPALGPDTLRAHRGTRPLASGLPRQIGDGP